MRKELYRLDPKPEDLVVSRLKNCSNTFGGPYPCLLHKTGKICD